MKLRDIQIPFLLVVCLGIGLLVRGADGPQTLKLHARHRQAVAGNTNQFKTVDETLDWDPRKTAIVVCDMWNEHWCKGATRRVGEMAPRMNEVLKAARARGVFIIHCPSDTMKHYEGRLERKLAQAAPKVTPVVPLQDWCHLNNTKEAPLPIDDSDGGCDDEPQCQTRTAWSHQIDALEIQPGDAITDSAEAYYLMQQRGIENVIVMGVHLNMCVLGRPFSIRQMVAQGKHVVLMRDMTDTMYNSRKRPYVPHCVGTDLMIEHVEKYWCPSITSVDFLGGKPFRFAEDKRPTAMLMIGEDEYHTWETLPEFARTGLEPQGVHCDFAFANATNKNDFDGLERLPEADLLIVSVRRRTPSISQMDLIRKHLAAGRPVVGIRTASHAFGAKPEDERHVGWDSFDREVLGAHYENHYGVGHATLASVAPGAINHPLLTGVSSTNLHFTSHLYKSRNLAPTTTVLLTGKLEDQPSDTEPIAWINTPDGHRIFYTSLGSPEDFSQPAFRRLLLNGILWALNRPIPPGEYVSVPSTSVHAAINSSPPSEVPQEAPPDAGPLSPAEAARHFHVAEDFEFEQVLAEPDVAQPVFLNFDERGRMWVVEYRQYPAPAGLKQISHDNVWRSVYDQVPPPPPHHFRGADRITIHEDTTGTGIFNRHTTFVEGLNITTAVEHGRGGVWVLNPPYLLFYPDSNHDDIPDGDPEVRLSGFGIEDTHSVANSLRWGPDGWLYGCQGSTVTGNILVYDTDGKPKSNRPVYSQGQNIWRYHPEQRRFEIFSEGGGNAFGCEMDAAGRIFSGHNGGDTRGFHYDQGAYLQKGFEKHGPLSNPYAFGYFPPMPHAQTARFTHNFILYDGAALPTAYAEMLFGIEPLQGRIVLSRLISDHTSYRTEDISRVVTSDDRWFRPVDIKVGPDGAIYVCDWYDQQINHWRNYQGQMDASNGRIYRLKAKGSGHQPMPDLHSLDGQSLVHLLATPNKWFRQTVVRLLADRQDSSLFPVLRDMIQRETNQTSLEALWALHAAGGWTLNDQLASVGHPNPQVRLWSARLIGDDVPGSPPLLDALIARAHQESVPEVRKQLAATARRMPSKAGLAVVQQLLMHDEDAEDTRIPLMIWWAIEANCSSHSDEILSLLTERDFWDRPLVRKSVLDRLMRRFAQSGTRSDLLICARLLDLAPSTDHGRILMSGFEAAYKGRSWTGLPDELLDAMNRRQVGSMALKLRQNDSKAWEAAMQSLEDEKATSGQRIQFIDMLADLKSPRALPGLLKLVHTTTNTLVEQAAIRALAGYDETRIGTVLLELFPRSDKATQDLLVGTLTGRAPWTLSLLKTIESGKIPADVVPRSTVRNIQSSTTPEISGMAQKLWSVIPQPSTEETKTKIAHLTTVIQSGRGDPYRGRDLFEANCAVCHRLFERGASIGPDLTAAQRNDLGTMLLSIVNPSAEIREGYEAYSMETRDGRSLNGFLADRDPQVVVLRTLDGQNISLPRSEVTEMKGSGLSLMPEGLLDSLKDQQVRDLFAYLRCTQPLVGNAVQ